MDRKRITVKYKKLNSAAVPPRFGSKDAAGMDFTAISMEWKDDKQYWEFGTGIAVEIPTGWVGLCFPRSSISNTNMSLANCVGVVDSDYRGEVKARFREWQFNEDGAHCHDNKAYETGDRIFQMVLVEIPEVTLEEIETLSDTDRGAGGWGSTGR